MTTNGICNGLVFNGNYIDGSWVLSVYVDDLDTNVSVRVNGNVTLGSLMHQLVENCNVQQNWSDHAMWWKDHNIWLLHNQTTLDQYCIQSDAKLVFRRKHNDLQIVLPSLTSIVLSVNYADTVFKVVRHICNHLSIRHAEELSLTLPISQSMLETNCPLPLCRHGPKRSNIQSNASRAEQIKQKISAPPSTSASVYNNFSPYATLTSNASSTLHMKSDNSSEHEQINFMKFADCYLRRSAKAVFSDGWLPKPKTLVQIARLNSGWLSSSNSLLEQGVYPTSTHESNMDSGNPPILYLRFKYQAFYDIILKYDAVRINQLFEQCRWSVLAGNVECTEDEMIVLAACQLQVLLRLSDANQTMTLTGFPDAHSPISYPTMGAYSTIDSKSMGRNAALNNSSPDIYGTQYQSPNSTYRGGVMSGFSQMDNNMCDGLSDIQTTGRLDEVDELLSELEQSYGTREEDNSPAHISQNSSFKAGDLTGLNAHGYDMTDTSEVPTLVETIKISGQFSLLKRYISCRAAIKEDRLHIYKDQVEQLADYSLRDCTVIPDVNVAQQKFKIKLSILLDSSRKLSNVDVVDVKPSPKSIRKELSLRLDSATQYASWLAACQLCSRGKTLASCVAYKKEVNAILELLKLQTPSSVPSMSPSEAASHLGDLTDFCTSRIIRKASSKDVLRRRITEAHVNLRGLSLLEAKRKYIETYQRINRSGYHYFIVKFREGSSQRRTSFSIMFSPPTVDMIAICQGRVEIVDSNTCEVIRSWNTGDLKHWSVNWDKELINLYFRDCELIFHPLSSNCKTITEFIGGYVILSQRNLEKSQTLSEQQFHRLTCAHEHC